MLNYSEALSRILQRVPQPAVATVELRDSTGLVLARSIQADLDLPPFDKSFMDGYALRSEDLTGKPGLLRVAGVVPAGISEVPILQPGEAWQIMTGAPIPTGADAVQMVEKTERRGERVLIKEVPSPGTHIAPRGDEVLRGDVVLEAGRVIGPAEVAVLATFGHTRVSVYQSLTASIISTGDELVEIDQNPLFGQIRNSNAWMLQAQCHLMKVRARIIPFVPDDPARIAQAVDEGLQDDLLIFSGGVSMGEFDYVYKVLEDREIEIFFHKAAIKPGKPLIVGRRGRQMIFGLPGNPVSSFVTFEIFARPALRQWQGSSKPELTLLAARLGAATRQQPGRLFFKPGHAHVNAAGEICVEPIDTKGSADIVAFARANSLLLFPADQSILEKGETVQIVLLEGCGGLLSEMALRADST